MQLTSGERWRGLGERGRGPRVSPCDTFAEDTLQQFVHIGAGITGAILLWEIFTARLTWFLFPDLSAISCSPSSANQSYNSSEYLPHVLCMSTNNYKDKYGYCFSVQNDIHSSNQVWRRY